MAELEFLGNEIGGRWVKKGSLLPDMTMFSFGVGEDISFELEAVKRGVKVFLFDPTPKSISYMKNFDIPFYPIGISHKSGKEKFYFPHNPNHVSCSIVNLQGTSEYFWAEVLTLKDIIKMIGVNPDIIKLDVEGEEYRVINGMNLPKILMVEFHGGGEFLYVDFLRTKYKESYVSGKDYLFI